MVHELAHQIGLIPLLAMLVFGRRLPAPYWWVAVGLGMSWVGDTIAHVTPDSMGGALWWPSAQFALIVFAFARDWAERVLWVSAIIALAILSSDMYAPGPYWLLTVAGSFALFLLAYGPLCVPLATYFGAGTLAYAWMVIAAPGDIMVPWYVYQGCRVAAFGAFIGVVWLARKGAFNGGDRYRDTVGSAGGPDGAGGGASVANEPRRRDDDGPVALGDYARDRGAQGAAAVARIVHAGR